MSNLPENVFNRLNADSDDNRKRLAFEESNQFEQERVKFTMQRLGLGKADVRKVTKLWYELHGSYALKFAAFNQLFPTFPFLVGTSRLRQLPIIKNGRVVRTTPYDYHVHRDAASVEPERFKDFAGVPFRVAYENFYNSVGGSNDPRNVCLVFPRKGFLHGMCIHNDQSEQYWTEGLCWVYKVPKSGVRLYVQPYTHLIDAIHRNGRGWRP